MDIGQTLAIWTVRLAVAFYVISLWRFLFFVRTEPRRRPDGLYVASGTAAWSLCVIHVLLVFAFFHEWSHQAAWDHTAEVTERVTGLRFGGGLYVNYGFLAAWGFFVFSNFRGVPGPRGTLLWEAIFHAVAVFMMINATAVFGPWWWKFLVPIPAIVFFLIQRKKP